MSIAEDETDPLAGVGPSPLSNVADKRLASTLEDIRPLFSDADPPDQDSVEGRPADVLRIIHQASQCLVQFPAKYEDQQDFNATTKMFIVIVIVSNCKVANCL